MSFILSIPLIGGLVIGQCCLIDGFILDDTEGVLFGTSFTGACMYFLYVLH